MAKTYAQLKTYARARANMENSDFIGAPQEGFVINDAYRELYHLLVDGYEKYFVNSTPVEFTLAGSYSTTVATDLYKLMGVEKKTGDSWTRINPFNFSNRTNDTGYNGVLGHGYIENGNGYGYSLVGRDLFIKPEVDGDYRYWYVQDAAELSLDADEIAVDCERWWKYIAMTAAVEYLDDEESDTGILVKKLDKMKKEIEAYRSNRQEESLTIANVEETVRNYNGYEGVGGFYT